MTVERFKQRMVFIGYQRAVEVGKRGYPAYE